MSKHTGAVLWALFLVSLSALVFGQSVDTQVSASVLDVVSLRKYVVEQMAAGQVPGIAISVVRGNGILWEEGFGMADRENRIPADPSTAFYVASVTKAMTGTAIMVLADQGKINLDRPVNEYLGTAKVHSPMWNADEATVRRVATHTAGLTTYYRKCELDDTNCKVSTDTAIRRYGILFWPPGEHFDYSNLGYGILGEVVARVSGKSYADFLRDQVFRSLGMEHCFVGITRRGQGDSAAHYDSSSHARTPLQLSDTPGASSAHCSAHDLALFGMFALGEHRPTQQKILSDASFKIMLNPTVETGDGERYGFGWSLQHDHHGYVGLYAQGGTNDSFAVLQMIPSEKIAVAVVANTGTTIPFGIVDKVLSGLLPHYGESLATEKPAPSGSEANTTHAPGALPGTWAGAVQSWKGKIPIAVQISASGQVLAKWAKQNWMAASKVEIADPRLYCVVHGQIGTPDAPQSRSDIELELYLRGKALAGAATTKDGVQLPYWVELKRTPSKLDNNSAH